ncbi:hypothetical protein SISSUDRAFT_1046140 [Sistotremastrum suecicum HHB10207 ss-3]|uniref:G-protein coupled receptors family 1 profile domain-containing protein n=1 Tax=Sistotremastrum suecicum HHB10207 ss-3 TaxID=1314776 RepID=A0A166E061_9AGAM|nr:hypothetical protein SISSUDRAFT_1046140 [Sistotremastrum suecicum HHB10207 ss-3]
MPIIPTSVEENSMTRRYSVHLVPVPIQLLWFSLLLAGQLGLFVFLVTLTRSKRLIPRLPVLHNFLLITFLGSPIYLMLFYSGDYAREFVHLPMCTAQAALVSGLDCAFTLSSLLHVFESWRTAALGENLRNDLRRKWIMIVLPYAHWVIVSLDVMLLSTTHPDRVYRSPGSFYCSYHGTAATVFYVEYAVFGFGIMIVQGFFCHLFWTRQGFLSGTGLELRVSRSMFFRVALFTFVEIFGIASIVGILATRGRESVSYCLSSFCASASLLVFLIFATQQDLLQLWFPCLYRSTRRHSIDQGSSVDESRFILSLSSATFSDVMQKDTNEEHGSSIITL